MKISQAQVELIKQEAQRGNSRAQWTLGWMYLKGSGIRRDYRQAFHWYSKSAEQGNVMAENDLRIMFQKGIGVERDLRKAASWAIKAAELGHVQAQAALATFYEKGNGVAKNPFMAYVWLTIASELGYHPVLQKIMLWMIKKDLTMPELQEAQRFIMNWHEERRKRLVIDPPLP